MQRLQRPHIHKLNGFDDPTKCFFVSKILEGFKRKNPGSKDLRMPVSSALLKQLINSLLHVYKSSYEASMFASAFSLALFFFDNAPGGRIRSRQEMRFGYACC